MRIHLLLACGALLAAAPVCHARTPEVGVQDDGVFLGHYGDRGKAFELASQLRVSRVRVMVQWSKVVRGKRWDFSDFDRLLDATEAQRIKTQVVLTGPAPASATANHRVGPYKPNARRFAPFVAVAVRHFGDRVDRYSIWNEPNHK